MADLIDRQLLLKRIADTVCKYCDGSKLCKNCELDDAIFVINTQATVAPKKGEWISVDDALPKDDAVYLVMLNEKGERIRHGAIDTDRISIHGGWERWQGYVTHWLPIIDLQLRCRLRGEKRMMIDVVESNRICDYCSKKYTYYSDGVTYSCPIWYRGEICKDAEDFEGKEMIEVEP